MRVLIGDKVYEMSREQANKVIRGAAKQVPNGIYAVEMKDYCELRNDLFDDIESLKAKISECVENGLTVHFNISEKNKVLREEMR